MVQLGGKSFSYGMMGWFGFVLKRKWAAMAARSIVASLFLGFLFTAPQRCGSSMPF
jgi:hypothetical protein